MRSVILFLGITVAFSGCLAVPAGRQEETVGNELEKHIPAVMPQSNHGKSVILLRRLSTLKMGDFISDLIEEILKMTPKEFLIEINQVYTDVDRVTISGLADIDNLIKTVGKEIEAEIIKIRDEMIKKISEEVAELLSDFSALKPILSGSNLPEDQFSDYLYALLNKTLEQFLRIVEQNLATNLKLLGETRQAFLELAKGTSTEVSEILKKIAGNFGSAESVIVPTHDKLKQVLTNVMKLHGVMATTPDQIRYRDLLDSTISSFLGFHVELGAWQADETLSGISVLLEATRDELTDALALSDEVQTKVMNIYDNAVDDVIQDIQPIFKTLLLFRGEARSNRAFNYNLLISLLGLGKETFKSYVQSAATRVENTVNVTAKEIVSVSLPAGLETATRVLTILQKQLQSAAIISRPLFEIMEPLFHNDNITEVAINDKVLNVQKEEWLDSNEKMYNRDALIVAVSKQVGFRVSQATKVLQSSLEGLDELMEVSMQELDAILSGSNVDIRTDLTLIMNKTLDDIHRTLQPMMDVLLPFLPSPWRSNKNTAYEIYNGINGLDVEQFLRYSSAIGTEIVEITSDATVQIYVTAIRAEPDVHEQIFKLLSRTAEQIRIIIKPFVDIVGPIISPLQK